MEMMAIYLKMVNPYLPWEKIQEMKITQLQWKTYFKIWNWTQEETVKF